MGIETLFFLKQFQAFFLKIQAWRHATKKKDYQSVGVMRFIHTVLNTLRSFWHARN